jgi:hypothetical protein
MAIAKVLKPGNEKEPPSDRKVSIHYRLPGTGIHFVSDREHWQSIADHYEVGVKDLIWANFKTLIPEEINWYLHHYVCCDTPTEDRYNWRFTTSARSYKHLSPRAGAVFIPPKSYVFDDDDPIIGEHPLWQDMSFWFEGTIIDVVVGVIIEGNLAMRYEVKPHEWHCWPLRLKLLGRSLGWSGVSEFRTTVKTFHVDTKRFNPKATWDGKFVSASLSGLNFVMTVHDGLKQRSGSGSPVRGHFSRDLTIAMTREDSPDNVTLGFYTTPGKFALGRGGRCSANGYA